MQTRKEINKKYKDSHKEQIKAYNSKYSKENREKINIINRRSYQNCIERRRKEVREYAILHREQRKINSRRWNIENRKKPKGHLDHNIGNAIGRALNGNKAGRHWESLVGYTIEDLMTYFGMLFDKHMNWSNYGSYWDVDHIKPLSLFNYKAVEDPEFRECWALANLQPMEHIENIKKGNKF